MHIQRLTSNIYGHNASNYIMLFPKEFQTNELLYGCWVEVRLDKTLVRHSDVAFLSHVNRLVKSCILSLTLRGDWAFLLIFPVQPCSLLVCVC